MLVIRNTIFNDFTIRNLDWAEREMGEESNKDKTTRDKDFIAQLLANDIFDPIFSQFCIWFQRYRVN